MNQARHEMRLLMSVKLLQSYIYKCIKRTYSAVQRWKFIIPVIRQESFTYCSGNFVSYFTHTNLEVNMKFVWKATIITKDGTWYNLEGKKAPTCTLSRGPDSGSLLRWITIPLSHLFIKCALPLMSYKFGGSPTQLCNCKTSPPKLKLLDKINVT